MNPFNGASSQGNNTFQQATALDTGANVPINVTPQTPVNGASQPTSSSSSQTPQGLDPRAYNLTKAIALQENGGQQPTLQDYSNRGKSGERGLYQFTQPTWNNYASQILGNAQADPTPENQNAVAYGMVKRWMDEGYTPLQVASMWNAGEGNPNAAAQGLSGVNQYGVPYNTRAYGAGVLSHYNQLVSNTVSNKSSFLAPANGGTTSPNQNANPNVISNLEAGNLASVSAKGGIGGVAGNLLNFALPIVNDVWKDVAGSNNKTLLQQAGDLGLSVLWFIPGLGDIAEGAIRGGELAAEGARAAEAGGGALKFLGNPIVKGALTGYGAGTAANLSQGQGIGEALTPQVSNILGAVTGGAFPLGAKVLSKAATSLSGIDPRIANALAKDSAITPELHQQYIQAAQKSATDLRATHPYDIAGDALGHADKAINDQVSVAGKLVGKGKQAYEKAKLPVNISDSQGFSDWKNGIENTFGITFNQEGGVVPLPNRVPNLLLSPTEGNRLGKIVKELNGLTRGSSVRKLSDVIDGLDNNINSAKATNIQGYDPLEAHLISLRSGLDESLRRLSPDLSVLKDNYSLGKNIKTELDQMAGTRNQRATTLIKRVMAGDKGGPVKDLFGKIKDMTGIDLISHAALAAHAIEAAGSQADKSELSRIINEAVSAHAGGFPLLSFGANIAGTLGKRFLTNPARIGAKLVSGKAGKLSNLLQKTAISGAAQAPRALSGMLGNGSL